MILTVILTIIHVIVCLFLVIVVLLQSGKAADLAGAFGGMGSQTVFGPRGAATVLTRATTGAAIMFMVTSLSLSVIATRSSGTGGGGKSVLETVKEPATTGQPPPAQIPAAPEPQPTVELIDPETGKVVSKQPFKIPTPTEQKKEEKKK